LNSGGWDLHGCKIYVALFPCNECAKLIIQSGIKEIVYLSDKYNGTDVDIVSKRILNAAGVKLTKIDIKNKEIVLKLE
jgi:dCMP deaminase